MASIACSTRPGDVHRIIDQTSFDPMVVLTQVGDVMSNDSCDTPCSNPTCANINITEGLEPWRCSCTFDLALYKTTITSYVVNCIGHRELGCTRCCIDESGTQHDMLGDRAHHV
jgi:hypothetical protein